MHTVGRRDFVKPVFRVSNLVSRNTQVPKQAQPILLLACLIKACSVRSKCVFLGFLLVESSYCTGKKTPGEPGRIRDTHRTHGTHGRTDHTDEPHNHPNPDDTPARPRDGRNRSRLNSRMNSRGPGADRSPRPTQKRPPAQQTRPCLHPLPERLPAPARRRSAK